jgi:tRNA dimethylallyltransferase
MVEMGINATRQLAKRQLTWLRADRGSQRLDCSATVDVRQAALEHLFARLSL